MLKKIRVLLALLFFVGITLVFLDFTGTLHHYFAWMAHIQFLPAVLAINVGVVLALIVLTFLFGRVYCSVICPLGVMQDCFSWLGGKAKKNRFHFAKGKSILRVVVLVLFVLLMILGLNSIAILIAPYSAWGRIATSLLQPLYVWINNVAAGIAESADSYAFYDHEVLCKGTAVVIVSAVTLLLIGFLSFRWGRLWCNTICPVGTVLGFVSKFSLFKPVIDASKCNGCTKCARNCKAMCINSEEHAIDYSRCVACMDCLGNCRQGAISYRFCGLSSQKKEADVDSSRRKFMATTAAVAAATALHAQQEKVDGGMAVIEDKQQPERQVALKPFGAQSLKNFASRCTACQLCVSECPSQLLTPSTKFSTLLQPEMNFQQGFCRPDCTRCSEVCPAGAIQHITPEEKSAISIGHAVVLHQNCLSAQGIECNACSRHCPAEAITLIENEATGRRLPVVNESRCLGCGACEYYCPSRPIGAIYVEGREVHTQI